MFKLNQSSTYTWPVAVNVPTDGGKHDRQTFDGEFKRISDARLKEIRTDVEADKINDSDFAREVLVGWRGVTSDGTEVPFSETTLAQLLDIPGVASAVVMAFVESLAGLRRKN